ncbi:MAG: hypothetical protein AAF899_00510 [Pseudomonadota bacterium]
MLNAAMVLGIVGGLVGMVVGFFGYGFQEAWTLIESFVSDVSPRAAAEIAPEGDPAIIKLISLLAPILSIAGGAMVHSQRVPGAALMAVSAGGMTYGFGFNVFTMFPIAMCGVAAILAMAGTGEARRA